MSISFQKKGFVICICNINPVVELNKITHKPGMG